MNSVLPSLLRPTRSASDALPVGGGPGTAGLTGGRNKEGPAGRYCTSEAIRGRSLGGDFEYVDLATDAWVLCVEAMCHD
jgi:hypothetical protein